MYLCYKVHFLLLPLSRGLGGMQNKFRVEVN
nr:MAG TPA: hypothetical protein [Inoviridae sp.]